MVEFARDDAGDQKPGNDEENIDTNKAAGQRLRKGMKNHDQQHGHGAQAVNVRPIAI